jgi:hypothetical protein
MRIAYVDEAGCLGSLPTVNSAIQPVFVLAAVVIEQAHLARVTRDFVGIKRKYWPNLLPAGSLPLDYINAEVKGAGFRDAFRKNSRRRIRHAFQVLDEVFHLLEDVNAGIFGRIWIKGIGGVFDGKAVYTSSIQDVSRTFQNLLADVNEQGLMVLDSRLPHQNSNVSHSIFTQRFKVAGDAYPNMIELPVFGQSDNHAGIQICDLLCSAVLFPVATATYCIGSVQSVHVNATFDQIRQRYGVRMKSLQHRWNDPVTGRWRGGLVVDDKIGQKSGKLLFQP